MNFGDNLKVLRKSNKISQEELAEKVGVSRQSVSKWETGDSYPEMNNILELCNIFHCKINDLVHTSMNDIDSLDEEIKMKVVKFEEKKQKQMKGISKTMYVLARIFKWCMVVCATLTVVVMVVGPMAYNKIKIEKEVIKIGSIATISKFENVEVFNRTLEFLNNHSKTEIIIYAEVILVCVIISLVLNWIILNKTEKLFENIYNNETPFSLENVKYIKGIGVYLLLSMLFSTVGGNIFGLIISQPMDIEISSTEIILVILIFAISFIFEYGYEIQKDSKGVMYNEKK